MTELSTARVRSTPESDRVRNLVTQVQRTGVRHEIRVRRAPLPARGTHFVTLVKPEILLPATAADVLAAAVGVLGESEVTVVRCAVMPAEIFGELGLLLRHYPRLHRVAAEGAGELCSDAERELVSLSKRSGTSATVGGFEAASHDAQLSAASLEARCRRAGIHKLGSGTYASVIELGGRRVTVLNGFVPALAASYNDPTALVGLIECHSHREIADLRANVLGTLDPTAASPTSLRGALSRLTGRQHAITLSEGRNGIHLSAGHLEGMFQAWRYFAAPDGEGLESTALGRSLVDHGIPMAAVEPLLADHNLTVGHGRTVSPHGATENLSRTAVVERVREWVAEGKGRDR